MQGNLKSVFKGLSNWMNKRRSQTGADGKNNGPASTLTELERAILILLIDGNSYADICRKTGYSENLIALALDSICKKTKADNIVRALVLLHRSGEIHL